MFALPLPLAMPFLESFAYSDGCFNFTAPPFLHVFYAVSSDAKRRRRREWIGSFPLTPTPPAAMTLIRVRIVPKKT
ncbi:hypothetical protein L218DRAFT_956409 [Marasmius fiardii PR-910]|nr:hypothetical protein L218DRAFT_956409 [Marasmius fiardii PR-910]